jgi:uncharacterized membrane protein YeaQ/YmgE (transglycosylase-associated protein family)
VDEKSERKAIVEVAPALTTSAIVLMSTRGTLRDAETWPHNGHMLFFIIGLIVWGFIVGGLARLALPGPDPMPWYATIGLGLGGSLVGGIIARILIGTAGGILFSLLGAILLLYLYRRFVQHRGITGPSARL